MRRFFPGIYLAINVACALVMLYAVHRVAVVMAMEKRMVPDAVDGVTFFTGSALAWGFAALTNLGWLCLASFDLVRRRSSQAFWWLGGAVAVWGAAIVVGRLIAR
jgi:hypothetical protein